MNKIISILIVNLNNLEYTKDCINDLIKQDCSFNLMIVDQNSTENGTKEYFDSLLESKLPKNIEYLRFYQNTYNQPLNHIWNWFAEISNTKYLCMLNNDVRICPNFLSTAIKVLDKEPMVGIINHVTNNRDYRKWSDELDYKIIDNIYRQGWDFIIRKECYNQIPEELEFFFGDDYIYSTLYSNNFKGAYILNSPMIHYECSTTEEKGGVRDLSNDKIYIESLKHIHNNISFNELSKWKPEFDILEKLDDKQNIQEQDNLIYKNITLAQTPNIISAFTEILPNFVNIIEIGFHRGGLSIWLNDNKPTNCNLICYDITKEYLLVNDSIDFRIKDCYLPEVINEIKELINKPGKTLVLCDGGNKNYEFNTFSNFLKVGDVIMCHDYCDDLRDYKILQNNIKWFSQAESFHDDIKDSILNNNLEPYYYNTFKNVLWGSYIKKQDTNIKLSILICSLIERRKEFLDRLLNILEPQTLNKEVEIIIISDNAKRSIGQKRNDALNMANGEYVCFIDDDDLISDNYVDYILEKMENKPDVIVFDAQITFDSINPKLVKYGREYDYIEKQDAYYRQPNHLMVHRKSNITEIFKDVKTGEDDEWASRMLDRIVTQERIDKILYFYDYKTTTKKYFN